MSVSSSTRTANITTTLVLGGTGNTGRRLIEQLLLAQNQNVRAIVRSKERFHELIPANNPRLKVIEGVVLEMQDAEFEDAVTGCDAVVSCLGHNMDFKGIFGKPRELVTDSIKRVCKTIQKNYDVSGTSASSGTHKTAHTKVILMGSNGVANPNGMDDIRPRKERALISFIRFALPPHKDNEMAAAFLSKDVGAGDGNDNDNGTTKGGIEWVVVRPDDLVEGDVSEYTVYEKPQAGLFGGGQTTRANVAHFMKDLITKTDTWKKWVYQMPVPTNIPA